MTDYSVQQKRGGTIGVCIVPQVNIPFIYDGVQLARLSQIANPQTMLFKAFHYVTVIKDVFKAVCMTCDYQRDPIYI